MSPAARAEYPLLEELNRQTQSLYTEVEAGLVRLQLPLPRWMAEAAAKDDPLRKWGNLVDPLVRAKLEQHRLEALGGAARINIVISSTTQPAAAGANPINVSPSGWHLSQQAGSREIVLESTGGGASSIVIHSGGEVAAGGQLNVGGPLRINAQAASGFSPNNIGLLLDDGGHVLVPLYIERETIGAKPVRVMIQDVEASATFVGSDDKTQMTILKLDKKVGRPVRFGAARPMDGSLVMMLNPASGTGRLALWTGGERDFGVAITMDGSVAGIVRYGQFLGGPACKPMIEQLIRTGSIQRPVLGARLTEVRSDDPLRKAFPALDQSPALLIDEVTAGSLAERAGLRKGDFILKLGAESVGDLTTWAAALARPGEAALTVLRGEQVLTLKLDIPGK